LIDARVFVDSLALRGIRLFPDGDGLIVEPASKLTDDDCRAIRQHKPALLTHLRSHTEPASTISADSRSPLISPEVRTKIEAIEADARAKGWPAELLWNAGFWDRPRGLAALLDVDDEIVDVTGEEVAILKCRRDIQRFRRNAS
jgi:TubC N-terminal docking domain